MPDTNGVAPPAPAPPVGFVLDNSVTMAWFFHDEQDDYADAVAARLPVVGAVVPRLWCLEVAAVLVKSERRGRCTAADTADWLASLARQPITADGETEARAWPDSVPLARWYALSVYDATYLELALRRGLPIATLDKPLLAAAQAAGVARFEP